jgi:cytochrome c oxidase subunit II
MSRPVRGARRVALCALPLLAAGCSGWQSALDPKGPNAAAQADLFWLFTGVCTAVWVLVVGAVVFAILGRRAPEPDPLPLDPRRERRVTTVVAISVVLTGVVLLVLTGFSYATQKKLYDPKTESTTLRITGHMWWWEILYENPQTDRIFTTANEIHIPVGEPITIKLASSDVIHSFWVPNLSGKLDLIPGRENVLRLAADQPGTYRGQCAEFCGFQHAHMSLLVIAESKEDFDKWKEGQIKAAEPPSNDESKKGLETFLGSPCVMCHSIRGTPAGSRVGPDLTHIASRQTLAAGTLPRTRGTLAAWILDPQTIKPGAKMPTAMLLPEQLDALLAYMEGLQ